MSFAYTQIPQDQIVIPGENNFGTITPYFMHQSLLDQVQSEIQQKPVYVMHELVQLRFAGDRYYSPVLPVDSMYRKDGLNVITYAERWAPQYRQFLQGEAQIAEGTPLDELTAYGITPAQLSLCRALKIYSIEALYHLEGSNLKSLGVHANDLKPMAKKWMEAKRNGDAQEVRIRELEAKLAAMSIPAQEPKPEEIDQAILAANYEAMTEDQLRDILKEKTGKYPVGRPSHPTLVQLVKELA